MHKKNPDIRMNRTAAFAGGLIVPVLLVFAQTAALQDSTAYGAEEQPFVNSLGMEMVRIEAGAFRMGSLNPMPEALGGPQGLPQGDYDEQPVRNVTISKPFFMSVTEVMAKQYRAFRPQYKGKGGSNLPARGISWYDAAAFCKWLSEKEGKAYRLATEAQWEEESGIRLAKRPMRRRG